MHCYDNVKWKWINTFTVTPYQINHKHHNDNYINCFVFKTVSAADT